MNARIALVLVFALASPLPAQDVYKSLTPDQMETLLKDMEVTFKKVPSKNSSAIYYDFTHNGRLQRLHYFQGKDIMLDSLFNDYPIDLVNRWNRQTKFTRASLYVEGKDSFTVLESNLDLIGGVTDDTIRRFFKTFQEEVVRFDKFTTEGGTPQIKPGDDRIFTDVTPDKLETVLKNLNINYKKLSLKQQQGSFAYDFESNKFKIRLYNFAGKDLKLDAAFKQLPLDKVNQYNFERKFVRVVLYQGKQDYTTLEANLDCAAGVSENIIRTFLRSFPEEAQAFAEYINKNN